MKKQTQSFLTPKAAKDIYDKLSNSFGEKNLGIIEEKLYKISDKLNNIADAQLIGVPFKEKHSTFSSLYKDSNEIELGGNLINTLKQLASVTSDLSVKYYKNISQKTPTKLNIENYINGLNNGTIFADRDFGNNITGFFEIKNIDSEIFIRDIEKSNFSNDIKLFSEALARLSPKLEKEHGCSKKTIATLISFSEQLNEISKNINSRAR